MAYYFEDIALQFTRGRHQMAECFCLREKQTALQLETKQAREEVTLEPFFLTSLFFSYLKVIFLMKFPESNWLAT